MEEFHTLRFGGVAMYYFLLIFFFCRNLYSKFHYSYWNGEAYEENSPTGIANMLVNDEFTVAGPKGFLNKNRYIE